MAGFFPVQFVCLPPPHPLTPSPLTGDEVLDIHGSAVTGLSVSEVVAIIRAAPDEFLATVKPFTALKKGHKADTTPIIYCTIQPQAATPTSSGDHTHQLENPAVSHTHTHSHCHTITVYVVGVYGDKHLVTQSTFSLCCYNIMYLLLMLGQNCFSLVDVIFWQQWWWSRDVLQWLAGRRR